MTLSANFIPLAVLAPLGEGRLYAIHLVLFSCASSYRVYPLEGCCQEQHIVNRKVTFASAVGERFPTKVAYNSALNICSFSSLNFLILSV